MSNQLAVLLALSAIVASLLSSTASLGANRYPWLMTKLVIPLFALSGVLGSIAAIYGLTETMAVTVELPFGLPWLHWQIRLDALSALFLLIISMVAMIVAIYSPGYIREYTHHHSMTVLGGFSGLFLAGMQLVVLADDAFLFMIAWELMSLASYFLVTFEHEHPGNRRAGMIYLLMAETGALCILLAFGVLAAFGHGFAFSAIRQATLPEHWASIAFVLAFTGFGMKAGLFPAHAWLPEAHPVAPSHISALMSGVMLKVAVYGMLRFCFDLLEQIFWSWGVIVLIIGCVSALLGVLFALVQTDIKRLLAYSSIENIGIIFIAIGLAMIFSGSGHAQLAALGLVAALYHCINHALFKSLSFLSAGAIIHATHTRNIEQLGGLQKVMPWTGLMFLIASIAISALPPLNGFVSEWLTFQTALQAWTLQDALLRLLLPVAAAVLALTGALSAACFVRAYGISFLGQARSKAARKAREVSLSMRLGLLLPALLCIAAGLLPGHIINILDQVTLVLLGQTLEHVSAHGWLWVTPINSYTASYSAPLLLLALLLFWLLIAWWLRRGKFAARQPCSPWDCGFSTPDARMQYTATAFSQPFKQVFAVFYRAESSIKKDHKGKRRYQVHFSDPSLDIFYHPLSWAVLHAGRLAGKLQSGNVRLYLAWSLTTLLVLLWIIS